MHRLHTQIEIKSSPERVWALLMDFPAYPKWNPFVRSIAGVPAVGETLNVELQPAGKKAMSFRPKVLACVPQREFRWLGRVLVPGVFDGEHYFQLEPQAGGRVVFRHGENFSGVLVPLIMRSLTDATQRGFLAMNEALKVEAEKAPG
jgi:hypothetical protein